jgi:hypothetical protein
LLLINCFDQNSGNVFPLKIEATLKVERSYMKCSKSFYVLSLCASLVSSALANAATPTQTTFTTTTPIVSSFCESMQQPASPPACLGEACPVAPVSSNACGVSIEMVITQDNISGSPSTQLDLMYYYGSIPQGDEGLIPLASVFFPSATLDTTSNQLQAWNLSNEGMNSISCQAVTLANALGWNCTITNSGFPPSQVVFAPGQISSQ